MKKLIFFIKIINFLFIKNKSFHFWNVKRLSCILHQARVLRV